MDNQIFSANNMKRYASPDEQSEAVRVREPGLWISLSAAALLLAGAFVWAVFGRIETMLTVPAQVIDGRAVCYVEKADLAVLAVGDPVMIEDEKNSVCNLPVEPIPVSELDPYINFLGDYVEGEWVYVVWLSETKLPENVYEAVITVESVRPIVYFFN